ncbi:MAG: hypothetical protein KA765_13450 [Thermoflexales bacterium]|nr:hypothetical protein [Thermoflexales bacterium]
MSLLQKIWAGWKRFGHFMGDLLARVVLTVFYFTIFLPFGIVNTLFGDPLDMKKKHGPKWVERTTGDRTMPEAQREF